MHDVHVRVSIMVVMILLALGIIGLALGVGVSSVYTAAGLVSTVITVSADRIIRAIRENNKKES